MVFFARFIRYWLPALIWMAIMFLLSSRPHQPLVIPGVSDFVTYKFLHLCEYGWLYFLILRGMLSLKDSRLSTKKRLLYSAVFAILYACTDEFHQLFVPTREGRVRDVFIDTIGISIMYIYSTCNISFIKKFV